MINLLTIYNDIRHKTSSLAFNLLNYIKGYFDIITYDSPRYAFTIKKIELYYPNKQIKAKITYSPIGCYRLFISVATDLLKDSILTKFKISHAKLIIEISNLETCLDLNNQEQINIYIQHIKKCSLQIQQEALHYEK